MRYLVVLEKGPTSFGAYVPDLPGCIAVGDTREEVLASIHEAIEFHLEGLKQDGANSTTHLFQRSGRRRCLKA
jgi:predicted RNase H-like HicB family nuclease